MSPRPGVATSPLHVVFVLPPNLEGYGDLRIPAGFLVLGSLAEQNGHSTDYLIGSSPGTRRTCPSEFVFEVGTDRSLGAVLADFSSTLAGKIEKAQAAEAKTVLALSCFSSSLYLPTMLLAVWIRARFPGIPIAVGGYHPTVDPDSMLRLVGSEAVGDSRGAEWADSAGEMLADAARATAAVRAAGGFVFDYLFRGRAESSFLKVLDELRSSYGRAGAPRVVPPGPLSARDLRRFRYSRDVLTRLAGPPGALETPHLPRRFDLCFSFGCPHSCAFCVLSTRPERWEGMDVEHVIEAMELLHLERGVTEFSVLDANFAADSRWRRTFFARLAERPWAEEIQLNIQTSVTGFELDDFSILDRFGVTVQLGVESCSDEMLVRMDKTKNPVLYKKRLQRLIERMAPHADLIGLLLIFGYPGETRKTLRETIDFLFDECRLLAHPNVAMVPQLYLPLLGTEAANRTPRYQKELGFESSRLDWWEGAAQDRFRGLTPSRDLSLETCTELIERIFQYTFGGGRLRAAGDAESGGPPTLTVKTKLERRRFRSSLEELLADPPSADT